MAVWLIRAGAHGEYEEKFITENRVYVTKDNLDVDLSKLKNKDELIKVMNEKYPDAKPKTIQNWASQVFPFAHAIQKGDLVILPLKTQPAIQIGEVTSDYCFDKKAGKPFYHWRTVKWIGEAIPRANFGQDLLYSFGAFLSICRIQRNDAENRINNMRKNGWKPESLPGIGIAEETGDSDEYTNLEDLARDQIAQLISSRFKGHNLTRLVDAILRAQGYTTYLSPEGPDGGADIRLVQVRWVLEHRVFV